MSALTKLSTPTLNLFPFSTGKIIKIQIFCAKLFGTEKPYKTFSDLTDDEEFNKLDGDGIFDRTNHDYYVYPLAQAMRNIEIAHVMFQEIEHSLGFFAYRQTIQIPLKSVEGSIRQKLRRARGF